jgi:TetR/AcrR family transcriptional regulator, repressor for uid operon
MSVHSHHFSFPGEAKILDATSNAIIDRRTQILDAAEACFVRAGFHRTTMQDIASEAQMSPGNLYRYFVSKDAVMEGLADRDRADVASDFSQLEDVDDFMVAFHALGAKYFTEEPRERAILCLEIWAEATRSATFNRIVQGFQEEIVARMSRIFALAQKRGLLRSTSDPHALAVLISTISDGLFVRRAVVESFDAEKEVPNVLRLIGALLDGHINFSPCATDSPETEKLAIDEKLANSNDLANSGSEKC